MRTIGIVAHSAEGAALCYQTACRYGQHLLGAHIHPPIVMSAIPMGWSMSGWASNDHDAVAEHLAQGVELVHAAGADFWICPDNTAHIVLDKIADQMPLPGLHIAEVVCAHAIEHGWNKIGLLGTRWTMTGPAYVRAFEQYGLERLIPDEQERELLNDAIFEKLCVNDLSEEVTAQFISAIDRLQVHGAQCVVLGCTEIPLVINNTNSTLPTIDSTRLLAKAAIDLALSSRPLPQTGWVPMS